MLKGLTPCGEFHIERLHLNRQALIAHRIDELQRSALSERLTEVTKENIVIRRRVKMLEVEVMKIRKRIDNM